MKDLTKILVSVWLLAIFAMWNVGPKYQQRIKVVNMTERLSLQEAQKHASKNLDSDLFFNRHSTESFVRRKKIYMLKEKTWIPFVYKSEDKERKITEAVYTY